MVTKKVALQRNKIALFLAVMLMFCAFGTDGVRACDTVYRADIRGEESVIIYPGAREFFAESLPPEERQSVREVSADWQSTVVVRSGRITGTKNGPKVHESLQVMNDGLSGTSVFGEHTGERGGTSAGYFAEVIICYIHNQDGAKG